MQALSVSHERRVLVVHDPSPEIFLRVAIQLVGFPRPDQAAGTLPGPFLQCLDSTLLSGGFIIVIVRCHRSLLGRRWLRRSLSPAVHEEVVSNGAGSGAAIRERDDAVTGREKGNVAQAVSRNPR